MSRHPAELPDWYYHTCRNRPQNWRATLVFTNGHGLRRCSQCVLNALAFYRPPWAMVRAVRV